MTETNSYELKDKPDYALEIVDIHKSFFDNEVLKGISFGIRKGEVLGLLGSNGAGKSTLMKIINGVYRLDKGSLQMDGKEIQIKSAQDASAHGIAMVYQEFSLIPTMSVMENMFLGRELKKRGLIDKAECTRRVKEALDEFGIAIDPDEIVENLSIGNKQLVEIVKALMQRPSVLILDEPTASLTNKEIELLFSFIRRLKEQKIAIFLISHHMQEIMDICDRAVVLRNGLVEMNEKIEEITIPKMVEAMIGKKLSSEYLPPASPVQYDTPVLCIKDVSFMDKVKEVNFDLYKGEIVGVAGLLGSGRTEMLKCIYGLIKPDSGEILLNGEKVPFGKPWSTIEKGIAFVPENRRECGIVGIHSIMYNMLMPIWKRMKKGLFIDEAKCRTLTNDMKEKLDIKCTGIEQNLELLSGGNQQKVVFGKSLFIEPQILLLDDPTVGIDVEAKASVAKLIRNIADNGNCVLLVSSEMEELERLCDRVLVMSSGKIIHELKRVAGDDLSESALAQAIQMNEAS